MRYWIQSNRLASWDGKSVTGYSFVKGLSSGESKIYKRNDMEIIWYITECYNCNHKWKCNCYSKCCKNSKNSFFKYVQNCLASCFIYNYLQKILKRLRKLRKSCSHKWNINRRYNEKLHYNCLQQLPALRFKF